VFPLIDVTEGMSLRVEVFPADVDAFVDFYTRVLRFELEADRRPGYAAVVRGSTRIGAAKASEPVDPQVRAVPRGTELVLEVDDLDAEYADVLASGWPIASALEAQPWGLRDFRLFDPDAYYVRVTDRPAEAP
jgi:predicted enzyme related to lactoylglutathione lyase